MVAVKLHSKIYNLAAEDKRLETMAFFVCFREVIQYVQHSDVFKGESVFYFVMDFFFMKYCCTLGI